VWLKEGTTQILTIRKINWVMLFKKIIGVYIENQTKPINKEKGLLIVKAGGKCI
jgi:predicted alternative tryptophan synthase beta-subunit